MTGLHFALQDVIDRKAAVRAFVDRDPHKIS